MNKNMELGSEFNLSLNRLSVTDQNLFSYLRNYGTLWVDYGRTAIKQIPLDRHKKVLLPEFACASVVSCFSHFEKIQFYRIKENFQIDVNDLEEKINEEVGTIYIIHYFGFNQNTDALTRICNNAKQLGIVIVEDTTQSLFSVRQTIGHYCVASIRKWMPAPQGGVLYAPKETQLPQKVRLQKSTDNRRAYGQILKDLFLEEGLDVNTEYRRIFTEAEDSVDSLRQPQGLSDLSRFLISCVNIEELICARKRNAKYVENALKDFGIMPVKCFSEEECPLAYPLRVKKRDDFKRYLMEHRIYCAVHWPFDKVMPEERPQGKKNAETLISLPIDQRYGLEEIAYMMDTIRCYGGDLLF